MYGNLKFDIDELPKLKEDIVSSFNELNHNYQYKLHYDEEKNMIFQQIENRKFVLGVDYIGPSLYYAKTHGLSNEQILSYSISTREIGGHLVFPKNQFLVNHQRKSINQIRSYRFNERIDYFLFELKQWYEGTNRVSAAAPVLEGNREWFKQFDSFKGYIDCFLLKDFVNSVYEPYDLTSLENDSFARVIHEHPDLPYGKSYPERLEKAYIPADYSIYIEGCVYAIRSRTRRMRPKFTKL